MNDKQGRAKVNGDVVKPMIGIYDFSYSPYALGDALTRVNAPRGPYQVPSTVNQFRMHIFH